jgi:hypothetical protein
MDLGAYIITRYNSSTNYHKLSYKPLHNNLGEYDAQVNKLKPIDTPLSVDLPHSQYLELKSEQRRLRTLKNGDYNRTMRNFIGVIGVGRAQILCDTCHNGTSNFPLEKRYYYIALPGWKLRSTTSPVPLLDSVVFHVEKFQSYIRKNVIKTDNNDGVETYRVEVKDIPVKFKYSHKSQMLKIPVSKQIIKFIPIITTLNIALVLYALFNVLILIQLIISLLGGSAFGINIWLKSILAFIFFPFFIIWIILRLINLLRSGSNTPVWNADEFAFTTYNIIRLRILAYSITGVSIFFLLLNLFMRFIFSSYFTDDVVLNTAHLYPFWIAMHLGVIFFLVLHVFMQGKALKDEQDLTV